MIDSHKKHQYYYKNNNCNAASSRDPDCICWHDVGTGPHADSRPEDPATTIEWRIKEVPSVSPKIIEEYERLVAWLHSKKQHPDYEYETTDGPRKSWYDEDKPPEGEGWERNVHAGRNGWERFDYHEEAYWMRKCPRAKGR